MIGNDLREVENNLYGTVVPRLGSSLSLLSLNSTFTECSNVNDHPQNAESFSFSVQSASERTQFSSQQTAQRFENCHFTSTKPISHFNIIEYTELSGSLRFIGCSFTIVVGTRHVGVMNITAQKEVFPLFIFDTSSVTFSRSDSVVSSSSQFIFTSSPNTHFISSNFTSSSTSTGARTLLFSSSIAFTTITNCIFEKQAITGLGACLYDETLSSVAIITHSIFRQNTASDRGGSLFLTFSHSRMFHCLFESNTAGRRGGAMMLFWSRLANLEDVHFVNNHANQTYSTTNPTLAHFRGNDIGLAASNANIILNSMVGCTSTSVQPRIGFYDTDTVNGNVTNEETVLPNPTTTYLPTAASEWWMSEDGNGEKCLEATPCKTMSTVITAISSSETTKTGSNKVNVGVGRFSESVSSLLLSVEFVGSGWDRNSSTFTIVELSLTVDGNANFSLTSLSLLPLSADSPILGMESPTANVRLANVWIEGITSHNTDLFSFSSGSATFHLCVLNTITLTSLSAISLTGSCSLTMTRCWVMEMKRERGNGGSVIDSSTSRTVSISDSDFARCVSSGCSGCLSFSSSGSSSAVKLSSVYFSDNVGNQTDQPGITTFASDLSFSGFDTKQISTSTVQSISSQPHCLINASNSSFDSIPLSFSDFGITFPISPRFHRGTPLSRFSSLKDLFMDLQAKNEVEISMTTTIQQPLQHVVFLSKKITLRYPPVLLDLKTDEAITLLDSSYFRFLSLELTIPTSINTIPFVLESSSAQLVFWSGSIIFSELSHSEAFIRNTGGTLTFIQMTITPGLHFEGHSFIESVGGSFSSSSTLFDSFSSSSDGAVLNGKGTTVTSSLSSFVNCSARNGGAVAVELSGASYLRVVHESTSKYNVTITECMAIGEGSRTDPKGKGGAIFVNGTSTSAKPIQLSTSTANDARFEGNFASSGNDIFVSRSVFGGKSLESISGFGGGSHSEDFRIVVEGLDSDEKEKDLVQAKLLPSPKLSVNGSVKNDFGVVSGVDSDACKWTSSFCATLGFGVQFLTQRYLNGSSIPQTIQFVHNMTYTEKKIEIGDQDVTVVGTTSKDLSKSTISRSLVLIDSSISSGSFLFSVKDSGKLRVMNLDINCDPSSGVFDLTSTGTSLWIEEIGLICSVGPTHSCSLIRTSSDPISMTKCVLNTTKGSSGSASFSSPILSCLSPSASISLSSTVFSSFRSSCVLVEMTTDEAIGMKSVSFVDCSRSDSPKDTLVLVSSSNLDLVVIPSLWEDSFTPTTSLTRFMAHNTNLLPSDEFYESSLLFYLLVPSESIVCGLLSDEASTHPRCGSDRLRCSSIDSAVDSAMKTSLRTILVKTEADLEDAVSVTTSLEIKSDTSTMREVNQVGSSLLEVDGLSAVLSLSSLAFSFSTSNTRLSFFIVKSGTLVLTSCQIGDATTPQTLSSSMTSLFSISSSGVLTLVSTTITNVHFNHPTSGSLVHLSLGTSLIIDDSSELSEIRSNGKGRIAFVESENLESTASLESFQNLKNMITIPSTGSFSDSEKNDFVGKEGTIEESLLWHWFPHTASNSTVVVSSSGEDHSKCGLSLLPCHSVEHGFDSLKNSNSSLVLENDDSLSSQLTTKQTSQTISSQTSRHTLTVKSSGSFSVSAETSLGLLSLSFGSTATSSSVSFVTVASGASLIVSDCSFSSFSSLVSGSVVSGRIISGQKVEIGESEKETLFTSCSSLVDGGGMNVEVGGTGSLVISNSKFEDCSAVRGGSIFLTLTRQDEQTSWSFDVSGSSFVSSSSSSNTDMVGTNIFVSGSFFESSIETYRFPEVSKTSDPNWFWGVDSSSGVNSSLLVYLVPIEDEVVVDGIGGSEIGLCGHFGVSCSSIEKGLARTVPKDSSVTLFIRNTTSLTTPLTVSKFRLTFTGESSPQEVPVSSNGCFRLETRQLSLALIDFVSSVLSSSTSFVSVSSGASLAISSCSFNSFASSCSGSVLSATISASSSLSIDSCSFITCTSTKSSGSGVLDISLSLSATFTLSGSTVIDSCISPSADSDFIVIRHPSLTKDIIKSSLTLDWLKDSSTIRSFVGKEGTHPNVVPLFLYFSNLGSEGHVNGLSSDVSVCGFAEYPCQTLPSLWTRLADCSSVVVILDGDITHREEMILNKPLSVVGHFHKFEVGGIASEERKEGLFTITEVVSFSQTELCISSTFEHPHLFDVVDESLNLDGCTVSQTGTNTLGGSVIRVGEGASLVIAKSLFSSIKSSDELGGVVVGTVTDGATFKLDNNTFKWCECSGKANCVWMELKNESSTPTFDYSMTELIFEPSSSNSETMEMNVFVVGNGLDSLITESKWEGTVDKWNEWSVWVWDRQTGVNSSLLPYLIPISESVEVDGSGWEFTKCGHFHLFCRTVEFGLDRMESASIDWMKIVDSVSVENEIKLNGTLSFSGMKSSSSMIFSNDGSLILSKVGEVKTSLTLTSLVFSFSSRRSQDPLISSSDSTLIFTSCSFSAVHALLSPLIEMNEGLLKMEEVNASDIETSCALIGTLSGVEIVGCCFESIHRSSNGPTVLSASLSSDHAVRVTSTRFLDCLSNGVTWWVFLSGEEGGVEKESDWEGTFNLSSPRTGVQISRARVVGGEDEVEEMVGYSLIYEFYPRSSEMIVSTTEMSEDHVLCGNMKVACKTVDGGFSLTKERSIVIVGNGSLENEMVVDGIDVSVCGYREAGRLLVVFGGQIVNGENDELDSVSISSLSIDLDGSSLGCETFQDNSAKNSDFPSAHRNIRCENGSSVTIESLNGGDGFKEGSSAWISASDCSIRTQQVNADSPLFIPTLSPEKCSSVKAKKAGIFTISLVGTELIPCSLFLEVFSKGNESDTAVINLASAHTTHWNETQINLTLSLKSDLSSLEEENEWRGRLKSGNGQTTSDFLVKVTSTMEKKAEAREAMKTMIPIVIGVVVTLFVIVLIVIFLCCRRHKKENGKKNTEQEAEELDDTEVKLEEIGDNEFRPSANVIKANSALVTLSDNQTDSTETEERKEHEFSVPDLEREEGQDTDGQAVRAMCIRQGKMSEETIIVRESLYTRLHRHHLVATPTAIDKTAVKQQITRGLARLASERPTSEILSKLTSHWVLFDANGDICFRFDAPKSDGVSVSLGNQQIQQKGTVDEQEEKRISDEQRWVPPEVADGKEIVDVCHGTVFRLGLVLWEIETGLVPFGEVDGINAQRQLGSGIVLRMDRIEMGMAELITNCLQLDPVKRPTLAMISEHFNGKMKNNPIDKEKQSNGHTHILTQ
ncbi:hypothetical protein BLNAU_1344 [Blattamonas nauphoetae]|uniref:Protein kinase domain-containing protein n=1 Tax=Blattamonas nauphoetae TaxID=2049346 RepID=A0ABQ9YJ61_9EUKA|nr:hypothetical protein BLNAU_1344 [Blattamonas nauphoetae]